MAKVSAEKSECRDDTKGVDNEPLIISVDEGWEVVDITIVLVADVVEISDDNSKVEVRTSLLQELFFISSKNSDKVK